MEEFIRKYRKMCKRLLNTQKQVERAKTLNPLLKIPRVLDKDLQKLNTLAMRFQQKEYVDMVGVLRGMNTHTRNEAGRRFTEILNKKK